MLRASRRIVMEVADGIRLLGSKASHRRTPARGLVIMLHGWEGSIDSTYMLCTGRTLFESGYDIFRLNFRDHGRSHHLNRGLFYAVLLDEIRQAVEKIAMRAEALPVYLVGYSLGGNFVLRVLKACSSEELPELTHAVAISPVLNPQASTSAADGHPLIRRYFLKKWKRSLRTKAALYPDLYDFDDILKLKSIRAITAALLERYSDYPSVESYFDDYAVKGDDLSNNRRPATIIAAADDPIIPVGDFYNLRLNADTRLIVHESGGHNGFISGWPLASWYDTAMLKIFDHCR